MRAKITKRLVESLKPKVARYLVWDTELAGFLLMVQPSGVMAWYVDYRNAEGKRIKFRLGRCPGLEPEGARAIATKTLGQIADSRDVHQERQDARVETERAKVSTLGAFIEHRYGPWAIAHLRRGDVAVARLKADFAQWIDEPLSTFDAWRMESWRRDRLKAGIKPVTLNRQLDTLKAALSKAVDWKVIEVHPLKGLKRIKFQDEQRVRYLSPDEENRLRAALQHRETSLRNARDRFNKWREARDKPALPTRAAHFVDHLYPLVLMALNTGLRRGELFSLRWADLNLPGAILTVRAAAAKSGKMRKVPLSTEARGTLEAWGAQSEANSGEALVFPGAEGSRLTNVNKAWATAVELAKLKDFRFHDLRHSFASKLMQRDVNLNTVRELLGHSDIKMTIRYVHNAPDHLSAAVAKLA